MHCCLRSRNVTIFRHLRKTKQGVREQTALTSPSCQDTQCDSRIQYPRLPKGCGWCQIELPYDIVVHGVPLMRDFGEGTPSDTNSEACSSATIYPEEVMGCRRYRQLIHGSSSWSPQSSDPVRRHQGSVRDYRKDLWSSTDSDDAKIPHALHVLFRAACVSCATRS